MPKKRTKVKAKRRVAPKRRQRGRGPMLKGEGFFDDVGSFFKSAGRTVYDKVLRPGGNMIVDKLKKPSTYLGLAGRLPTPWAPLFTGASIATGLAGHGRMSGRGNERMFGVAVSN